MRIIGGEWKGRNFKVPGNLSLRPTTNFAKEGLFNVLENAFDLDEVEVLELFAGTGNISFEFLSRGVKSITGIERDLKCNKHLNQTARSFGTENAIFLKSDVFKYLERTKGQGRFDIIFADPPFEEDHEKRIHELIFDGNFLREGGWLIIEHQSKTDYSKLNHFLRSKKYGHVKFSIFELTSS